MEEKFSKEIDTKTSISQIKITMNSIISRHDQAEERASEMEDKMEEILHTDNHKKNEYF
jgi:hypothetical protein